MQIGICDDNESMRNYIAEICKANLDNGLEQNIIEFSSGEEVLSYCMNKENLRIDLLFLDIVLQGMNGIEVKDKIIKNDKVWRIVFISAYENFMNKAFGLKTLNFLKKPICENQIIQMVNYVYNELQEEKSLRLGTDINTKEIIVTIDNIEYFEAEGNYTKVYLHSLINKSHSYILITQRMGNLLKSLESDLIIRVHKSYTINLLNVIKITSNSIWMRDIAVQIPIGRKYTTEVKEKYRAFGRKRVWTEY